MARPTPILTWLRGLAPFLAAVVLAVVLHVWIRPLMGDFQAKILLDILINITLAVSLTLVNGFTGQFSIGHAAFMAVGAYVAAGIVYYGSFRIWGNADVMGGAISSLITGRTAPDGGPLPWVTGGDLLFAGALLAGGLVAAACGYLVGLPSLRLKGDYLAIVTLGFGEIVRVIIQSQTTEVLWDAEEIARTPVWHFPKYLGGGLGFSGLPFYTSLFWAFLVAALTVAVAFRLKNSTHGRAFLSVREDEIAAEAMGVRTTPVKVRAFVLAAFFAGLAGGLFAHTVGVQLNPAELGFMKSFDVVIMVVLGGLGSISGAAIAAAILTVLPELLRRPDQVVSYWPWLAGLLVIGVVLFLASRPGRLPRRLGTLGVVIALVGLFLAGLSALAQAHDVDLTKYRMVLYALALIVMMILRPQGLLGIRELWDKALWRSSRPRTDPRPARAGGPAPPEPGAPR